MNDIAEYNLTEFHPSKYSPYFEVLTKESKKASSCENEEDIRSNIDIIDNQIVSLITQRTEYVKGAAKLKKADSEIQNEPKEEIITSKKHLAEKYNVSTELIDTICHHMINYFINEKIKV